MADNVSLLNHIELMVHAVESRLSIRIDAVEKAVQVAKIENDRRLEGMNEFREQLREQATHFASNERIDAIEQRYSELRDSVTTFHSQYSGKSQGMSPFVDIGIRVALIVLALIAGFVFGELIK